MAYITAQEFFGRLPEVRDQDFFKKEDEEIDELKINRFIDEAVSIIDSALSSAGIELPVVDSSKILKTINYDIALYRSLGNDINPDTIYVKNYETAVKLLQVSIPAQFNKSTNSENDDDISIESGSSRYK